MCPAINDNEFKIQKLQRRGRCDPRDEMALRLLQDEIMADVAEGIGLTACLASEVSLEPPCAFVFPRARVVRLLRCDEPWGHPPACAWLNEVDTPNARLRALDSRNPHTARTARAKRR